MILIYKTVLAMGGIMKIPRIIIGGTNSGCGKTTVSIGIMAALVKKGICVQPFKVGPDYIDPAFHTFVTRRYSRNLDSWMLDNNTVLRLLQRSGNSADISIIEGVMGFYDGLGGTSIEGSTAHVAQITKTPAVLVVNGESLALSAAAIVKGFCEFNENVNIAGVIFNNIYSEAHYQLLKEAIENNTSAKVLGYLDKTDVTFESRHLGLVTAGELSDLEEKTNALAQKVLKGIDLETLIKIAETAPDIDNAKHQSELPDINPPKTIIGVAMDKAFSFYYRDGLELLEKLGAELKYFSPLEDESIPGDADGLYIGGGYPELFVQQLERNISMKKSIYDAATKGMPVYGECGGLMYLSESIFDIDGKEYLMSGVIPGKSNMTPKLQTFGYTNIKTIEDNILSRKGQSIKGHEFHFSTTDLIHDVQECFSVSKAYGAAAVFKSGYKINNVLAGYPHIHFCSNPEFAEGFVESCKRFGTIRGAF